MNNERSPFITDPRLLAALEGQAYVVLRPSQDLSRLFHEVQSRFRAILAKTAVTYPAEAHVTVMGFPAGTSLTALHDLVAGWAHPVPPLELEVEGTSAFQAPYRIPILQIRRTPELGAALDSLFDLVKAARLPVFPDAPGPRDWMFHMSLAYCSSVDDSTWAAVNALAGSLAGVRGRCTVGEAELVSYHGGSEHLTGIFVLRGDG
jgi:2'-5' RNA ligase